MAPVARESPIQIRIRATLSHATMLRLHPTIWCTFQALQNFFSCSHEFIKRSLHMQARWACSDTQNRGSFDRSTHQATCDAAVGQCILFNQCAPIVLSSFSARIYWNLIGLHLGMKLSPIRLVINVFYFWCTVLSFQLISVSKSELKTRWSFIIDPRINFLFHESKFLPDIKNTNKTSIQHMA